MPDRILRVVQPGSLGCLGEVVLVSRWQILRPSGVLPSMKVTIPWDKPRGIRTMPSGFTPVVTDLLPSVKVNDPLR